MKKIVLLTFTLATACPANQFIKDHEAYLSWMPVLKTAGGVVVATAITVVHWRSGLSVAYRIKPSVDRFNDERAAHKKAIDDAIADNPAQPNKDQAWFRDRQWAAEYEATRQMHDRERAAKQELTLCPICMENDNRPLLVLHRAEKSENADDAPIPHYACPQCLHGMSNSGRSLTCPACRDRNIWDAVNRARINFREY